MLDYKIGDICEAPERVVIQGCNAQGVMGSGVAKALRNKYPEVYIEYMTDYRRGLFKPGYVVHTKLSPPHNNKWVCSIISQERYGTDGKKYARYSSLVKGVEAVRKFVFQTGMTGIATPKIGCGLGGLDWEIVSELLDENFTEYGIAVTVYTQ